MLGRDCAIHQIWNIRRSFSDIHVSVPEDAERKGRIKSVKPCLTPCMLDNVSEK